MLLAYGTLFPATSFTASSESPWTSLIRSWPPAFSLSDVVLNVAVYVPFGIFVAAGFRQRRLVAVLVAIIAASVLSTTLELAQAYFPSRTQSILDIFCNTAGGAIGALVANLAVLLWRAHETTSSSKTAGSATAFSAVGLWSASQLAPFVPSLDIGNLRHALAPLWHFLNAPTIGRLDALLSYFANLTAIGLLLTMTLRRRRLAIPMFVLFLAAVFGLKTTIVGRVLAPETVLASIGAVVALMVAQRATPKARAMLAVFAVLSASALAALSSGGPSAGFHRFNWLPFASHILKDAIGIDSILETAWSSVALAAVSQIFFAPRERTVVWAGMILILLWNLALEAMQLGVPGRYPDITPPLIAAGAWVLAWRFYPFSVINRRPAKQPRGE